MFLAFWSEFKELNFHIANTSSSGYVQPPLFIQNLLMSFAYIDVTF